MVSIVLVTYNRAARLRLSIQDILNQTFQDFELIICDDCSTDSTEAICREFEERDSRIRYFRQDRNIKMPANCNFGIEQASSDYIAILHDGDRFKPDLIEQWYQAISTNDSVGFVFNSIGETDERNRLVKSLHEFEEGIIDRSQLKKAYFRCWRFDSPVWGEAMVRKSLLEERGMLHHKYGFFADVDLWMDLLHNHDAYYCSDTLITGPTKKLQPRLFEDNLIDHFLLMFDMHLKHRRKSFSNKPLRWAYEMTIFWIQSLLYLSYCLLLVVKNESFKYFLSTAKLLKQRVIFLIFWTATFILYPILYPILRLFNVVKQALPQSSPTSKKVKEEPVDQPRLYPKKREKELNRV